MPTKFQLFDLYSLRARFFPAVLALLALGGLVILFSDSILKSVPNAASFTVVFAAVGYLLANIVRHRGKTYEDSFLARTGGWQTTVLLRHGDETIDHVTKSRYHRALEDLSGMLLPTMEEENTSHEDADSAYRSATKVLIERRRGSEFSILHAENAAYGFWRNLTAIKPIALVLAILAVAIIIAALVVHGTTGASWTTFLSSMFSNRRGVEALAYEIVYIIVLLLIVSDHAVLVSARTYAEALFRTLDVGS
ncbi:hypothetical protein EPN44_08930 [bacterium]|nr:MAG: hypothetical protein EPN44_08930 [bacterium]